MRTYCEAIQTVPNKYRTDISLDTARFRESFFENLDAGKDRFRDVVTRAGQGLKGRT